MKDHGAEAGKALNRLAKWRNVFTGWQLGSRSKSDPEAAAVSDAREAILMLRVEVSALVQLLTEKRIFTSEEWAIQLLDEVNAYEAMLRERFPGFEATDYGMAIDVTKAAETTRGWPA